MRRQEFISQIKKKQSFLFIGLDSDIKKIPSHLLKLEDPIFEFNKQIIDATKDLCVAYKPNVESPTIKRYLRNVWSQIEGFP